MWSIPTDTVRAAYRNKPPGELIGAPVDALVGVSTAAAKTLRQFGIGTIFDLASSNLFATAYDISRTADGEPQGFGRFGVVPGDRIDAQVRNKNPSIDDLQSASMEVLRDVGTIGAKDLERDLSVFTVRELGLWPPYHIARSVLSAAYGLSDGLGDFESPPELVPGARRYPTHRAQYQVIVLDTTAPSSSGMGSAGADGQSALPPLGSHGPLDLIELARGVGGATAISTGTIQTYTQSWYTEGLALGQLLHTLALAPGESTRIAMIDWSRAARASAAEGISESEALTSTLNRGRTISETVNSVLKEAQSGFSGSFGHGGAGQVGTASGGAGSADFSSAGYPIKLAGGSGESTGFGTGTGFAVGGGWTSGERNLSARLAQNIQDSTHQASNLVRTRWATVVTEVEESETERITTRTVTNYNHMHALSIEYFEVVQLHRVVVELTKVDRCLFVPFKVFDFGNRDILWRYRRQIAQAALIPEVGGLVTREPDSVIFVRPAKSDAWLAAEIRDLYRAFNIAGTADVSSMEVTMPGGRWEWDYTVLRVPGGSPFDAVILERHGAPEKVIAIGTQASGVHGVLWQAEFSNVHALIPIPTDPAGDVRRILLRRRTGAESVTGKHGATLVMSRDEMIRNPPPPGVPPSTAPLVTPSVVVSITVDLPPNDPQAVLLVVEKGLDSRDLTRHLTDNALYYTQAILRSLDATMFAQLLSAYSIGGRSAVEAMSPMPVSITGNYLVFRIPRPKTEDDAAWNAWMAARDIKIGERNEDVIPLPSGGVFAEAVPGRFNSAEKLDVTRFWNWQDSPIPIVAPDIAAIQAGSRAKLDPPTPGQLSAPVLNIVNPPALPDPTGLAAALAAIQNGNAFRDMSGLAATIGFAQAAMSRSADAARDAAAQAGRNMQTAADIYRSAFGGGAGAGSGLNNISEKGAAINQGRDMDNRGVPRGGGTGGLPGTSPGGSGPGGTTNNSGYGTWEGDAAGGTFGGGPYSPYGGSGGPYGTDPGVIFTSGPGILANPIRIAGGQEAKQRAAGLLMKQEQVRWPRNQSIDPGTVHWGNTMIVAADEVAVYYMRDDVLYAMGTSAFLRDGRISAFIGAVAGAEPLAKIANVEVALLAGIFAAIPVGLNTWWAGPAAIAAANFVDVGLKSYANRDELAKGNDALDRLLQERRCIREEAPQLLADLESTLAWQTLRELPSQMTAEQIAFFIGRLIRGFGINAQTAALTLGSATKVLAQTTGALLLLIDPVLNTPAALEQAIKQNAIVLAGDLAQNNATVGTQQTEAWLRLLVTNRRAQQCLRRMKEAAEELLRVVQVMVPRLGG